MILTRILIPRFAALLLLLPTWSPAMDPEAAFQKANTDYREGRFTQAAEGYESLIREGHVSADVHFNLGNAYFKSGAIPRAILNYEKAERLRPGDPDIAFNLKMANLQTVDKIEPLPVVFYKKWWNTFVHGHTADSYAAWGIGWAWFALLLAAVYLFVRSVPVRKAAFMTALAAVAASTVLFYFSYRRAHELGRTDEAILFATNAYIKSSPDDKSTNLFMLHAGTKVQILDELEGWKRIRIANGSEGWIESETLEVI